jgi:biotin synthase
MVTSVQSAAQAPESMRVSLAAAMTLGLERGLFYRNARLRCINLLMTHPEGCVARCAYCGLTRDRRVDYASKGFIRVKWPTFSLDTLIDAMVETQDRFSRICISMITRPRSATQVARAAERIRARLSTPISGLLSPTVLSRDELMAIRDADVDRVGIAVDAATPELFDAHRGRGVRGPHRWERYWEAFAECLEVFGRNMAGCHLIVGLGETEREMAECIQRVRDMGGLTHLFCFYPEPGSRLQERPQPPVGQYRRIQLARFLIDEDLTRADRFEYDARDRIVSFGLERPRIDAVVGTGRPFETSGCPGPDGTVACNRPFANCRPGPHIRNYPFALEPEDVARVAQELLS